MSFLTRLSLFSLLATTLALPTARDVKPAYFLLAGDSTTAVQSSGGGGWGNGFLNYTLCAPASGQNFGHNGATTVSFREGGDWGRVLDQVDVHKNDSEVFVTIQVSNQACSNGSKGISSANTTSIVRSQRSKASSQHLTRRILH